MKVVDTALHSNAWDRYTRKPAVLPPADAWDRAAHVYGPLGSCSLDPTRTYEPPEANFDDLLRMHKTIGISCGPCCAIDT